MKFTKKLVALVALVGLAGLWVAAPASAADPALYYVASTAEQAQDGVNAIGGEDSVDLPTFIRTVINLMLYIVGVVAVIMVIIGGIKYVTSNGDANAVSSAKNTVLYAVIGIIVAVIAFAIVNWVITALIESSGS